MRGGKTSPSMLRIATSPNEGRLWQSPQSERFRQRLPYQGSWRAQARLRGCTKESLTNEHESDGLGKQKRRRKLFAAKSASCLTRTGDTLINSQVL